MNKKVFKMEDEELQQYLHFKKRGFVQKNKKKYDRKKVKNNGFD